MRISVVGLGKLGSPLAAVLAAKGHDVVGVDLNGEIVRFLQQGKAPFSEPFLQQLLDRSAGRLTATTDFAEAVAHTDATFIIVPTPTDGDTKTFSNQHVLAAVASVGRALWHKSGYHLVVVTSTVMPGSTGGPIRQALESASGRRLGHELGLCYNPEFIALGSVIRDMLRPDMVLIGESDRGAGDRLEAIYRSVVENDPAVMRMNFVNAELTKIAVNTFVTTKISYANMLAEMCEHLPGADVAVVTGALGQDSRIGGKYLRGALGYGGPCFPRDNVALAALARQLGAQADIAEATDRINTRQVARLAALVRSRLPPGGTVAILGLSYKPDTDVVEESQGLQLAARLAADGVRVRVFDPAAQAAALAVLEGMVMSAETAEDCVDAADVVVVATAWPSFADIPPRVFTRSGRRPTIIDCWRSLPPGLAAAADVIYPGRGTADRDQETTPAAAD